MVAKSRLQKKPGPIARQITLSILRALSKNKRISHNKEVINADLIPKFHERVIEKHLKNKTEERTKMEEKRKGIIPLTSQKTIQSAKQGIAPQIPQVMPQISPRLIPQINPAIVPQKTGEYGKIDNLLKDPTLTLIECPGINKNIYVFQMGRRQITNIVLSKEDIMEILKKFSDKTKIPIIPGSFRAVTDNFFISAMVSEAELQFIIKKQSPYLLIQKKF
jgi:hypothetical protein